MELERPTNAVPRRKKRVLQRISATRSSVGPPQHVRCRKRRLRRRERCRGRRRASRSAGHLSRTSATTRTILTDGSGNLLTGMSKPGRPVRLESRRPLVFWSTAFMAPAPIGKASCVCRSSPVPSRSIRPPRRVRRFRSTSSIARQGTGSSTPRSTPTPARRWPTRTSSRAMRWTRTPSSR